MIKRHFPLLLLFPLILSGCAIRAAVQESKPPDGAYQIYFAVSDDIPGDRAVDYEYRVPEGNSPITGLVTILLEGPRSLALKSPFQGKSISLLSSHLEEGQLTLDLSEPYSGITGVDLTVASYCFALTLCQVEGVETVRLTVEGAPLAPVLSSQQLKATDVLLTGSVDSPAPLNASLYFIRNDGTALAVESQSLTPQADESAAQPVLDALLRGPSTEGHTSLIPSDTAVRSARVEGHTCFVDFTAPFHAGIPQDPEQSKLLLYQIVNSLADSIGAVEEVVIRCEGEPVVFFGDLPITDPVIFDTSLESQLTIP